VVKAGALAEAATVAEATGVGVMVAVAKAVVVRVVEKAEGLVGAVMVVATVAEGPWEAQLEVEEALEADPVTES